MKKRKIAIIGVLITVVSMVVLMLPLNSLFACHGDLSVNASACVEEGSTTASVAFTMSGTSGWNVRYKLVVDGSTAYETPQVGGWYNQSSPQGVSANLPAGSHTATFSIGEWSWGPGPGGGSWSWTQVDTETFEVEECVEPCDPSFSINVNTELCGHADITVNLDCCVDSGWQIQVKKLADESIVYSENGSVDGSLSQTWNLDLEPGDYRAIFTACCLDGDRGQEFTVAPCEQPGPDSGNITVVKRDPGGTLLAGAGFTVYFAESGNPAAPEGFTADSGMITFAGLPFGSYIVRETTAPAGFGLAPDQAVVLDEGSVAVTVNYVDSPTTTTVTTTATGGGGTIEVLGITEELPFTGQSMWLYIIGAAMLALAGGLTFVLRAAKSKE